MINTNCNNSDMTAVSVLANLNMSIMNMLNHTVCVLFSHLSELTFTRCMNAMVLTQNSVECMVKFVVVG